MVNVCDEAFHRLHVHSWSRMCGAEKEMVVVLLLFQRQVDVGPLMPLITCVPALYANVTVSDNM